MGLGYFNVCSYLRNLTSPLSCWHRGTSCQVEVIKDSPQRLGVLAELGTDMVLVTMAARIVQSVMSLGKNLLQKRASYWKIHPHGCMIKALQAALWLCWSLLDLLPLLVTVYVYKTQSRLKVVSEVEPLMDVVTTKGQAEPAREMGSEEFCKVEMGAVQEAAEMGAVQEAAEMGAVQEAAEMGAVQEAKEMGAVQEAKEMGAVQEAAEMGAVQEAAELDYQCEQMDGILNREVLVPSCRNPFIRSMICVPSKHLDSLESDEESEEDCSKEEMSGDSGLHESWTPKSRSKEDCDEESDWSDEDAWDEESNVCDDDDDEDELWASFCHDDPYNPLCFVMPTRASQPKKEAPTKKPETHRVPGNLDRTKDVRTDCGSDTEKQEMKICKKPVLSGYKSPHKCSQRDEEAREGSVQGTKKVRFSPKVTVHPLITWSFAHRMARKGPWEQVARDRGRFQKRIAETESAIGFCLRPRHRAKIWARLQTEPTC